jgi:hypothetical protein
MQTVFEKPKLLFLNQQLYIKLPFTLFKYKENERHSNLLFRMQIQFLKSPNCS